MITPVGIRRIRDADDFSGSLTDGYFLKYVASAGGFQLAQGGSGGGGTVTSVALTMPAEFAVAGSPITTAGTLAVTKANQSANTVYAGPSSGAATAPAFRSLVAADIPTLNYVTSVGLSLPGIFSVSGSPVTSSGTLTATLANQSANTVLAGPSSGPAAAPTFRALVAGDIPALNYVTSVGLSAPSIFTVSGSPVTSSGTLTFSLNTQNANLVFAGPSSGGAATPTFRALVPADYPVFKASGASHAAGAVPDPGSVAGTTHFLREDATWQTAVTSVALSLPAEFSVAGSPVTTSGTLSVTKASQSANTVFAGPASGAANAPTFRLLTAADYPIPSGATLPTSPVKQFFQHTPTGRSVLLFSDGTNWYPLAVAGNATVYVDTTNGTDSPNQGGTSGAGAFKTITYALSWLQGAQAYGSITVNVAAGTYREQVNLQGIFFSATGSLTINGTRAADTLGDTVATSAANGVGNGDASWGTLAKTGATWTAHAFAGLLIEITSGTGQGQIFVIHDNTATTLTITGQWSPVPDATSHFHIFGWGTRITGSNAGADTTPVRGYCVNATAQQNVTLQYLQLDYAATANVNANAGSNLVCNYCLSKESGNYNYLATTKADTLNLNQCVASNTATGSGFGADVLVSGGYAYLNNCRLASSIGTAYAGVMVTTAGLLVNLQFCYIGKGTLANGPVYGLRVDQVCVATINDGCAIDGCTSHGVYNTNGGLTVNNVSSVNTLIKNNGGWGVLSQTGGQGSGVSGLAYSTNTSGTYSPVTSLTGGNT